MTNKSQQELDYEVLMKDYNERYRNGYPIIDDNDYDLLLSRLAEVYPDNDYFNQKELEVENIIGKTIKLPIKMLSTRKIYSINDLKKWINNILEVSNNDIIFKVTPKLDGFAAHYQEQLITRGNGETGTDISIAIDRGLIMNGVGKGEITVKKDYFKQYLSNDYNNSRNVIAAVIKEGQLSPLIKTAIEEKAIEFNSFDNIATKYFNKDSLLENIEQVFQEFMDYYIDTDGIVIEIIDENIKQLLGSTSHHHKWQVAYKKNIEFHNVKVNNIIWQTSKYGRVIPVIELEPTKISGAIISRVTGHNYGNIIKNKIGKGSIVEMCRSGLVIPHITKIVKGSMVEIITHCPSCTHELSIEDDNLFCKNLDCKAQKVSRFELFFKTIGNCDGFGEKTLEKILVKDYSIGDLFKLSIDDFMLLGFGQKTSTNLVTQLKNTRSVELEPYRFLSAFGFIGIGNGGCEKILKECSIEQVFDLTFDDLIKIDGFGKISADSFLISMKELNPLIKEMLSIGFNLKVADVSGIKLKGISFVFTGKLKMPRKELEQLVKSMGGITEKAIKKSTDFLVAGEDIGANKIAAARKFDIKVLSEPEFFELIVKPK